ncbi:hypothetical protein N9U89_02725, partial [Candidatus Pelagibacter sp.]|nr:hypothetical protein [Candidatus Pelagibacter sp.]
ICFFDNEKSRLKNTVNFEIPGSLNSNLNFKLITTLLKENIRKLEKDLGFFLNNGYISVKSKTYQNILFSVKDIYDERKLDKEVIIKLVKGAMQEFYNIEKNLTILHVIINKYVVDDKVYNIFPEWKKFKKIVLELELICLNKNLINKLTKLFNECKIDVKKIISHDYAKKFLNENKDDTLCLSAYKIINGANQSEVILIENTEEKHSLFDRIFNFFD